MSNTPHLPALPAFFGNDSPFPPVIAPRTPSAKFMNSPSATALPQNREAGMERDFMMLQQEIRQLQQQQMQLQQQVHSGSMPGPASLEGGGLRPGQFIPSTANYPAGPSRYATPASASMPNPAVASNRNPRLPPKARPQAKRSKSFTRQQAVPPPQQLPSQSKGSSQQKYRPLPTPSSSSPGIQRPKTTEPRGSHYQHHRPPPPPPTGANNNTAAATASSMEAMHLSSTSRSASAMDDRSTRRNEQMLREFVQDDAQQTTPSLSVELPDLNALAAMKKSANTSGNAKKKLAWCNDVIKYVERKSEGTKISDPALIEFIDEAIDIVNLFANSSPPIPEALFLRGDLLASGAFPSYHAKNLKAAFSDFELSARMGHAPSWFRIGRDYETLGDQSRAKDAYERGCSLRDVGCIYRMGMASLLGQIGMARDHSKAVPLLKQAADLANLDTPQPSYIYGMLLAGEFSHIDVSPRLLTPSIDPSNPMQTPTLETEAFRRIQKAAYLNFGPAQYRCGWFYEYAQLECPFDPLLSVQYYSLASQSGEVEADLALSKWFLCGAEGCFDKNENLAFTFAEKAARKGLPSAEFAMGYYFEVGVGCERLVGTAQSWYSKAASHGNTDAKERLNALAGPSPTTMSRTQHESHIDVQLQRKRTEAKMKSDRRSQVLAAQDWRYQQGTGPKIAQQMPMKQNIPSMDLRRRTTMMMVEQTAKRDRNVQRPARGSNGSYSNGKPLPSSSTSIPNGNGSPRPQSNHPSAGSSQQPKRAAPGPARDSARIGRDSPTASPKPSTSARNSDVSQKPTSYETFGEMGFNAKQAKVSL